MKKEFAKVFLMGICTGISMALIVLILLQYIGVIPRWWNSKLSTEVGESAAVIEQYIDRYYWKDNVTDEELKEASAKGMVSALDDKYSVYYTSKEYKEAINSVNGDYMGIGAVIRYQSETDEKIIESIQEDTPAQRSGLKEGDRIIKVDGVDISNLGLSETVEMIKGKDGKEGKESTLTILRAEGDTTVEKEIKVVSEKIVTNSVSFRMLEDHMGYIQIKEFDKETVNQYKNALDSLQKEQMSGLVIDVRNNGGGSLSACISMLDRMLPKGKLITETSKAKKDTEYTSTDEEHFDQPVVILINGNSASASEVFAGTMQDREAATLVGVTSYGKGIVQTIYSLEKLCGGGLKLTTGEYLLPSGRSIHEKGLTPDIEVSYQGTSNEIGGSDDNQLDKAKEILKTKLEE